MQLKIGISKEEREKICEFFSTLLATSYALYLKTQFFHWNVESRHFYSYHLLFESQYEELAEAVDEIAERIRMLGSHAKGSFSAFAKESLLKEEPDVCSDDQMIKKLVDDHEVVICFLRKNLAFVESCKDGASSDFINKRLAIHEKAAWFLRSHLVK